MNKVLRHNTYDISNIRNCLNGYLMNKVLRHFKQFLGTNEMFEWLPDE